MKYVALILAICSVCMAQETSSPSSCPVAVAVAGTNIPLQSGNHIVLWFTNQSNKTVAHTEFKLFIVDSAGYRYRASQSYSANWETAPGAGGLVVQSAQIEEKYFGSTWRNMRGVEVQVSRVIFSDHTQWQSDDSACRRAFTNANYVRDMRKWNKELRADWNRQHPNEQMPSSSLALWLSPPSDGWQ
jgi:hypothetical protein